jgi:hypothetical protein
MFRNQVIFIKNKIIIAQIFIFIFWKKRNSRQNFFVGKTIATPKKFKKKIKLAEVSGIWNPGEIPSS